MLTSLRRCCSGLNLSITARSKYLPCFSYLKGVLGLTEGSFSNEAVNSVIKYDSPGFNTFSMVDIMKKVGKPIVHGFLTSKNPSNHLKSASNP